MVVLREAALALERARNQLWSSVRFMRLLTDVQLSDRAYRLATSFEASLTLLWQQQPATWILPQWQGSVKCNKEVVTQLKQWADAIEAFHSSIERNRWLMLRTRNIGVLAASRLKEQGVNGPVLQGSTHGAGDVQSRLVARLQNAMTDMRAAADSVESRASATALRQEIATTATDWAIPIGEAQVTIEGPRGLIGLHIESDGGEKPTYIEWQSPSAALLPLLPEILAGQKLADAEIILASLNLAMAEADG
ncbi:MAG: hypothetical protein NVS3B14_10170 [Ktedonobacteraceae bacterium]